MVSRETLPSVPPVARRVFSSDRIALAQRYAVWLADAGTVRGLIGPREVPRLWERHLINCAVLAEAIPVDASVADLGSGAGLPGLVLAIARPDLRVTLVEPLLRRTVFLSEVVEDLGLGNVEVVRGRAEALHGERRFDVVTSRALAPLERLLGWSMPLVAPTGSMLAMKGSSVAEEVAGAERSMKKAGWAAAEVLRLGGDAISPQTIAIRVGWLDPRKVGSPSAEARGASGGRGTKGRSGR